MTVNVWLERTKREVGEYLRATGKTTTATTTTTKVEKSKEDDDKKKKKNDIGKKKNKKKMNPTIPQSFGSSACNSSRQCTGRAALVLSRFRHRQRTLESEGRRKPDMIAYKELRKEFCAQQQRQQQQHGEIPGVPIGLRLNGRGEAAILGIHTQILKGIDARKGEPCYAVCVSGGYADDNDEAADGTILYTGSGGQKGGRQVTDQTENVENTSLIMSMDTQQPIRLLRGGRRIRRRTTKKKTNSGREEGGTSDWSSSNELTYYYEGLYRCTDYTYKESSEGPMVYSFTLVPIPGRCQPHRSIVVEPTVGSRATAIKDYSGINQNEKKESEKQIKTKSRGIKGRGTEQDPITIL